MSRKGRLLLAAFLCGLALAGCGDSDQPAGGDQEPAITATATVSPDPSQAATLSPAAVAVIRRAQDEVSDYCRKVARALAEGEAPTQSDFERVTAALDELAELAAEQPGAEAEDGTSLRLALGDIAENLEGTNCDSRLVSRIDQALAELPAE